MTLEAQHRREMGLYKAGRLGGLFGLRMGIMWAWRQMEGMEFVRHDSLMICVRAEMPLVPRCLRWRLHMWSGPVACEFFSLRRICDVSSSRNGGAAVVSIFVVNFRLVIVLLSL